MYVKVAKSQKAFSLQLNLDLTDILRIKTKRKLHCDDLGYFQVNLKLLETRGSSSSKFVPRKNRSSIFKSNPKSFRNFKYFRTK